MFIYAITAKLFLSIDIEIDTFDKRKIKKNIVKSRRVSETNIYSAIS